MEESPLEDVPEVLEAGWLAQPVMSSIQASSIDKTEMGFRFIAVSYPRPLCLAYGRAASADGGL